MKSVYTLFIVSFLGSSLFGQAYENLQWSNKIGTNYTTSFVQMSRIASHNNRLYQTGNFKGFSNFQNTTISNLYVPSIATINQGYLSIYDKSNGVLDTSILFQSTANCYLGAISIDDVSGNIAIAGSFKDFVYFNADTLHSPHPNNPYTGFIAILDSNYNLIGSYVKSMCSSANSCSWGVKTLEFRNSFLYCYAESETSNSYKWELLKFSSSCSLIWTKLWSSGDYKVASDMAIDQNGNIYISGSTYNTLDVDPDINVTTNSTGIDQSGDAFIISLDSSGIYRWHYRLRSSTYAYDAISEIEVIGNNLYCSYQGGSQGIPLNPNGSVNVTAYGETGLIKLNSSNGIYSSHLTYNGGLFYTGQFVPWRITTIDDKLEVLLRTNGTQYIDKLNNNLHISSKQWTIISYDTLLAPNVIFEFSAATGNINIQTLIDSDSSRYLAFHAPCNNDWLEFSYLTPSGQDSIIYPIDNQGSYKIIQAKFGQPSNFQCNINDSIYIASTSYCEGDSVLLVAQPGYSYLWNTQETNDSIYVSNSGTFYCVLFGAAGCSDTSNIITVNFNPSPIDSTTISAYSICPGGSAQLQGFGSSAYSWYHIGNDTIWKYDFRSGIPTNWSNSGTANGTNNISAKWEYRANYTFPDNSFGSRGAYNGNRGPINSTTASNGFVIFDSDYLDNGGIAGNFGNGLAASPHVASLTTEKIYLGANTPSNLYFTQYYRRFNGPGGVQSQPATFVDFSVDNGTTWTTTALNSSIGVNAETANNSLVNIPIPTQIQTGDTLIIRFRFSGGYYFWMIDDLVLTKAPSSLPTNLGSGSSVTVNQPGDYYAILTNSFGCSTVSQLHSLDFKELPNTTVQYLGDNPLCNGDSAIIVGASNNIYSWNNSQTNDTLFITGPGTYFAIVASLDGCVDTTENFNVVYHSPIDTMITSNNGNSICFNEQAVLYATTGGVHYLWSTGDTTSNITASSAGTFYCTITDSNSCVSRSMNFVLTQLPIPTFNIAASDTVYVCEDSNPFLVAPSNSISHTWQTQASQNTVIVSVDSVLTTVQGVDSLGIQSSVRPSTWALNTSNITDTLVLMDDNASGFNTAYGYSFPNSRCGCDSAGVVSNTTLSGKIVLISRGNCEFGSKAYYAQLAGASGVVIYNAYPDTVANGGLLIMSPGSKGSLVTIPTIFTTNSVGNMLDTGLNSTPVPVTISTSSTIQIVNNGNYLYTGTDSSGCQNTAVVNIQFFEPADTAISVGGDLSFCSGSSVTLTAASGQSYLWSTGDTTQSITSSQSGTYYAVVTTANGCTDTTATYTTTLFADPDTTVTATQTLFCASDSATISVASGYDYLWNTGDTTQSITVNTTGGYYVMLTSTDGCMATTDTTMITVVPDIVLPQITSNGLGWVITGSTTGFSVPADTNYSYQWGVIGGSIAFGQGTDSIAVTWGAPDSNVAVWVIISNGVCNDSLGISINISGIGLDEGAMHNVRLFPNPNDGYFTVEVGEAYVGASYEVVDGMGRTIERGVITSTQQGFDLADKPKGVYRINIRSNTSSETMVVIVQ